MSKEYPSWVCLPCSNRYGRRQTGEATCHIGICGVCNKIAVVTEPRDFGHLKSEWETHHEEAALATQDA